ncbi:hypothetical protein Pcinc_028986 [Petrolisthes cinctipes]|uniref:Carboxypeptidase n=1 Tax=Petrolisthes cinctipes TaxID=88211 RepID=A0AAE1F1Y3_PETCI|nr:hypothetical protein Pcinc_028986 [Petrolisthes cinctipes]
MVMMADTESSRQLHISHRYHHSPSCTYIMRSLLTALLFSLLALVAPAPKGEGRAQLDEDFGYAEVRPGAHMFWVMYHVDQPEDYTTYPLIMWLQGGPGASGVGYGNFEELGPYDINGNIREYAWTKKANVMFVDNPVGTGYSYVEDLSLLTTTNDQIASDLVELVKSAFTQYPDMQQMPFYVFAESYGGKMTVDFALAFDQAIKNGEVVSDFRGVGLGDSWISPMDSVNTWGMFLYQMGFVSKKGLGQIDNAAANTQAAVDAGNWEQATNFWSITEVVVMNVAHNVNFYNVLTEEDIYRNKFSPHTKDLSYMAPEILSPGNLYERHVRPFHDTRDALGDFMNGEQAIRWNIPPEVMWDSQGGDVFSTLAGDFMKPVIDSVVRLLTETDLHVAVFTGDLDLICDTPGTYRWIENMEWPDKPNFIDTNPEAIYITAYSSQAGTIQASGNFSLYTILRSGHMVPIDAPEMGLKMLDMIFTSTKKETPKPAATKQEAAKPAAVPKQEAAKPAAVPKQEAAKPAEAPKQEAAKPAAAPKQEAPKPAAAPKQEAAKPAAAPMNVMNKAKAQVVRSHVHPATPEGKRLPHLGPIANRVRRK